MKKVKEMIRRKPPRSISTGKDSFNIAVYDPSLTGWGIVILDKHDNILETEVVRTKKENKARRIRKGDDDIRRVQVINNTLLTLNAKWEVKLILSELPHGSQSAPSARMVGTVQGIVQMLSDSTGIPVEWYSEGDAKKYLFGRISASKKETIRAISRIYKVPWTGVEYKDEAIADALAIHHAATIESTLLSVIRHG